MKVITGHYRDEQGLLEPGTICIEHCDGIIRDAETAEILSKKTESIADANYTTISNGVWEFIPDTDQMDKVNNTEKRNRGRPTELVNARPVNIVMSEPDRDLLLKIGTKLMGKERGALAAGLRHLLQDYRESNPE